MRRALVGLGLAALALGCSKSSGGSATNTPGAAAGGATATAGAGGASTTAGAGGATAGSQGVSGAGGATAAGAGGASAAGAGGAPVAAQPCALSLTKLVPLPKSSIAAKARAFGPGVVATPTGFVVAVHEVAEDGSEDTLSLFPIAADGTVGATSTAKLSACFGGYSDTGVGMTIRGGAGLAAVARPACKSGGENTGGSLSLVAFGAAGDVQDIFLLKGEDPAFPELTIPTHRALAPVPGSSMWRISYLQGARAYWFDASGITPKGGFNLLADKAARVVSASSQNMLVQAAELDGAIVVSTTSAMAPAKSFTLSKGTGISLSPFPSGVVVASRISASTVRLDTIDDSTNLVAQAQLPTPPLGVIDVAPVTKAVAIVVGDAKRVSVLVSTVPEPDLAPGITPVVDVDPSSPLVTSFDGKAIAAAGGSGRVAAVWLSTSSPDSSSPLGGVALFECK
ncbi:MAG: hypothetical protein IT374_17645 [Polyangiaceae bacterium]|nr:hypothetical protein [Polyangiaceae bacterium]